MRVTYDAEARAAYVYVRERAAVHSTRRITDSVLVDLDADGNAVGVELLSVDKPAVEDIARPAADAPAP